MKNSLKDIARLIKRSGKIAIFTHINPDYDALGSSLALYYACQSLNKEVDIYIKDELTKTQRLLVDSTVLKNEFTDRQYDVFISTDVSSKELLGDYKDVFINAQTNIVIDHHSSNELIGKFTFREPSYSSCSEIIFLLIKLMKVKITDKIASLVYVGLSGDTNSFTNTNTNQNSYYTACECYKYGGDTVKINEIMYRTQTTKETELEKYLLNNYHTRNDVAYCVVTLKTLEEMDARKADCDFYSSKLISMEGINIAFSVIESKPNYYNLSFRSKYGFNVRDIASKFGGGGHIGAAGAKLQYDDVDKLLNQILETIEAQRVENNEN